MLVKVMDKKMNPNVKLHSIAERSFRRDQRIYMVVMHDEGAAFNQFNDELVAFNDFDDEPVANNKCR